MKSPGGFQGQEEPPRKGRGTNLIPEMRQLAGLRQRDGTEQKEGTKRGTLRRKKDSTCRESKRFGKGEKVATLRGGDCQKHSHVYLCRIYKRKKMLKDGGGKWDHRKEAGLLVEALPCLGSRPPGKKKSRAVGKNAPVKGGSQHVVSQTADENPPYSLKQGDCFDEQQE